MTQLTTQLRPIFRVARYILLIACVGLALMNAFQASRGKGDKWVSVIVLVLVATFMMMPAAALQMFGFDALSQVAEDLFGSDGDF